MKNFLIFLLIGLVACEQAKQESREAKQPEQATETQTEVGESNEGGPIEISEKMIGDYNGDGKQDTATVVQTRKQEGNPEEDSIAAEYAIHFNDKVVPAINIHCCTASLINEGDLNGDGGEELSVFQAPENGNTYRLITYSFNNGYWRELLEPLVIPVIDQELTQQDLQQRVFRENEKIFVQEVDLNDESFRILKKEANVKQ